MTSDDPIPRPDSGPGPASSGTQLLAELEAAGFRVLDLPEEQQRVFSSLSPEEVELLLSLKKRLDAVEPEVLAHGEIAGGALF